MKRRSIIDTRDWQEPIDILGDQKIIVENMLKLPIGHRVLRDTATSGSYCVNFIDLLKYL